jgi:hypothetical protein
VRALSARGVVAEKLHAMVLGGWANRLGMSSVCDPEHFVFEELQGDLLGQHHVIDREPTLWREAKEVGALPVAIEFLDVHVGPIADAVAFTGAATYDVEIAVSVVLFALGRGEIGNEEPDRAAQPCPLSGRDSTDRTV